MVRDHRKFLVTLSIDAAISAETDLYGKSVTDLQEDIAIADGGLTGTLKYVTGYTGYSEVAEEQEGNFLALHASASNADANIVVEVVGGTHEPMTLDEDGLCVFRITSADDVIKYTARKGEAVDVVELSLEDLVLEPAPEPAPEDGE